MPAYGPIAAARIKGLEAERDRLRQALEALLDTAAVRLDACAGSKVVAAARAALEAPAHPVPIEWLDAARTLFYDGVRWQERRAGALPTEHVDDALERFWGALGVLDVADSRRAQARADDELERPRNRVELRISIGAESWADAEGMIDQIHWRLAEADEGDHEHVDVASGGPGGSWSMVGDRDSGVDLEGRREKLDAWLEARRQARAETE